MTLVHQQPLTATLEGHHKYLRTYLNPAIAVIHIFRMMVQRALMQVMTRCIKKKSHDHKMPLLTISQNLL